MGIDCARLPGAAVRARQICWLVYRVRVQHRSAAAAWSCWSMLFLSHKTVSTERAQHTEISLPRDKEPFRFGSTRAKFARGSVRSAARDKMVATLRGKATNLASRGSRAQSIPGLRIWSENPYAPSGSNRNRRRRRRRLWKWKEWCVTSSDIFLIAVLAIVFNWRRKTPRNTPG
jgi:hypothetical protein